MDAIQLHYFKTVCQEGSYARAAEALYLSPQGLSKAIHKLEGELGVPLFTMTPTGIALTEYGRLLQTRADDYLVRHQQILNEVRALRQGAGRELSIGIQAGFSEGMGPDFLLNFILENPDLAVQVRSFPHERMIPAMRQPEIPVWMLPGNYDESLFDPLYEHTEKLFLLASEDHPLARLERVTTADLEPYPLISLSHDIGQQTAVDSAVSRRLRTVPDYLLNAADRRLLMRLVQSGRAISFNSGWHYKEYPGIRRLDLADLDVTIRAYLLVRKDACPTPALERFRAYVRATLGAPGA